MDIDGLIQLVQDLGIQETDLALVRSNSHCHRAGLPDLSLN
jgi:hypothetical protein